MQTCSPELAPHLPLSHAGQVTVVGPVVSPGSLLKYQIRNINIFEIHLCEVVVEVDALDVVMEEVPDGHGEVVVPVHHGELPEHPPHSLYGPRAVQGAVKSPGHMLGRGQAHQT